MSPRPSGELAGPRTACQPRALQCTSEDCSPSAGCLKLGNSPLHGEKERILNVFFMGEPFLLIVGRKERRGVLMGVLFSKVHCVGKQASRLLWVRAWLSGVHVMRSPCVCACACACAAGATFSPSYTPNPGHPLVSSPTQSPSTPPSGATGGMGRHPGSDSKHKIFLSPNPASHPLLLSPPYLVIRSNLNSIYKMLLGTSSFSPSSPTQS